MLLNSCLLFFRIDLAVIPQTELIHRKTKVG